MKYIVRVTAEISDDVEVDADSDEEAIDNALRGWSFTEASSWNEQILRTRGDRR